jgi:hypothetical protein
MVNISDWLLLAVSVEHLVPRPVPDTERLGTLENSRQQDVGDRLTPKNRRKVRYYLTE